jgi:hypothetical protein
MKHFNKRGHFVIGFIAGVFITLVINFFCNYHSVVDEDTCRYSIDVSGLICDFHYERNQ